MIACDTSSLIAYFAGEGGEDVAAVAECLRQNAMLLPAVVLTEILSDPHLPRELSVLLRQIPLIPLQDGYWIRAGELRSRLLARKLKSRVADALIAQSCLDADISLITRDRDFRHYVKHGGLKLFCE